MNCQLLIALVCAFLRSGICNEGGVAHKITLVNSLNRVLASSFSCLVLTFWR